MSIKGIDDGKTKSPTPLPSNLSDGRHFEFIDIPTPQTTNIFCSKTRAGEGIPQNEIVMTILACKCRKIATESGCILQGRLSPTNDQIEILYNDKKYNIILCGDGFYYLVNDKANKTLNLFKEANSSTPYCCSPPGIYFRPVLF
jgi:hypothetical protein